MEVLETPTADTSGSHNNTPPAIGEYWPGQGGIYGGILPAFDGMPARHMIFSAADAPDRLTWGPYGEKVDGTSSRTDGRANTATLLAKAILKGGDKPTYPAAEWAATYTADGHNDFHLPSQAELFMASLYAPEAFGQESWYWSSTQYSADGAFVQGFEGGYSFWSLKGDDCRVRAVRWIPL
jgi:hypothetical protein